MLDLSKFVEAYLMGIEVDHIDRKVKLFIREPAGTGWILAATGVSELMVSRMRVQNIIDRISVWTESAVDVECRERVFSLLSGRSATDHDEVANSVLLKKVFGYLPAFHDAHVLSIKMEHGKRGVGVVDLVVELRHWGQDDPNWTARGFDCVVTLTLRGVNSADISMDAFVQDNSVCDVCFTPIADNLLLFELTPNCDAGVSATCASAEITRIEPYCAPIAFTTI